MQYCIFLNDSINYKGAKFSINDWEKMSKLVDILDMFNQATTLMRGSKYVVCSVVLPLLSSLNGHMTLSDVDPGHLVKFKKSAIKDLNQGVANMKNILILKIAKYFILCLTVQKYYY